ncbi:MAG: hypothetical protein LBD48_08355 [Treponema sp.]|jgi:hypothetical protein|nr:hypothetical protein [Treponema sp.]
MKNIRLTFLLFAAGVCSAPLYAMDWPSKDAAMVRNFGFNDRGRPVLGTVFQGEGSVLASESGEVIFSRSAVDAASRLPSPLGAWTALDHGDGLVSIYSRYHDGGGEKPPLHADRGEAVAVSGVSGWTGQSGFYFVLYDRRERRWVNPSMIITPMPDTRPPQIAAVELRAVHGTADGKRQDLPLNTARNIVTRLTQGRYTVSVNAFDVMQERRDSLAPHRIICSVNGTEIGSLQFETISARGGLLMVYRSSLVPAARVYASFPAFEAGEVLLNRGQAQLEIIVQDIAGNSRSAFSRIIVE